MDYAADIEDKKGEKKYPSWIIRDAKWVWPIVVMYLPVTFFWALFDMQGSRWTLTATQMDGYWGTVKILPDQIQILNAFLILVLLPIFQKLIYPCINRCFYMTHLRKMSAGQLVAVLAFVMSGFVQMAIQKSLTPVPDYGSDSALMVTNGIHGQAITVTSNFWTNPNFGPPVDGIDLKPEDGDCTDGPEGICTFDVNPTLEQPTYRTPTFSWLSKGVQENVELRIDDMVLTINPGSVECDALTSSTSTTCEKCSGGNSSQTISSRVNRITNVVYYKDSDGAFDYFQVILSSTCSLIVLSLSVKDDIFLSKCYVFFNKS